MAWLVDQIRQQGHTLAASNQVDVQTYVRGLVAHIGLEPGVATQRLGLPIG